MASAGPNDTERITDIFCRLRDASDETAISQICVELQTVKPDLSMRVLASYLLRRQQPDNSTDLSNEDALLVLDMLVRADTTRFLKPASLAVKNQLACMEDNEVFISNNLTQIMVNQLSGDDVEVSVNAAEALVAACVKLGPAIATPILKLLRDVWQTSWNQVSTNNKTQASTVCVRCASAMVDIAVAEDALMQAAENAQVTSVWLDMLQYDQDPLLQMSTMDLLEKLAESRPIHPSRTEWLLSDSVVKTILTMAGGFDEPDPILGGAALRLVSSMCRLLHETEGASLLVNRQDLLTGFHHALHNWDHIGSDVDRLVIVDAISSFASASEDTLQLVLEDPVTRESWLSLSIAQTKLKAAVLVSIARVIDPPVDVDRNGDTVELNTLSDSTRMKLYVAVGQTNGMQDTTGLLLDTVKSPVPEVRIGCYALLEAVAKLSTGGQVLFMNGDFLTFLVTRENESHKEGRQAKYAIVNALLSSAVIGLLADEIVEKLKDYKAQGPHYAKGLPWELATE